MTVFEHPTTVTIPIAVTLRLANAKDLPKLEWYGQYRHFRSMFQRTFREQEAGHRLMLLADMNNFPIGHIFIQLRTNTGSSDRQQAYFYSFRVMEMFRRQGIGTLLLREAELLTLERHIHWVTIAAAKDNAGARRLYERLGYYVYGDDDGSWHYTDHRGRIHHVTEPCWLLEKHLRG